MNINWETIVDGFRGFEKLALEFVEENEPQNGCSWKPTKETRDGNHDAILAREVSDTPKPDFAVFVGYANNVDVWWMEAKYSAEATQENSIISRYRLDATIVSAILSRNISKIIFVTNLEIASKTIADIRKALIFSNSCSEVKFYTKSHLENWLLDKPFSFFGSKFKCTLDMYNQLEKPYFNHIEELSFYSIGNNFFQEPLSSVYVGGIYEIHFSISVYKDFDATLNSCINIQLLSEDSKKIHLKKGINDYVFYACIPENLEYEPISKLDSPGEYKTLQPISIAYLLENESSTEDFEIQIIPATAIKIINSENIFFDIPSQNKLVDKLCKDLTDHTHNPDCKFSLISIYGSSGIGKSYVLQLFKNKLMKEKQHILCSTYTFSGDKIDDIKVIKKIIFQLFFPYLYFEDLDSDYVNELRKNFPKIKDIFWNFVFFSTEIEDFIKYVQNPELLKDIFLSNICINNRKLINDIPQSAETLNLLLDAELIRKNDDDFFVSWHDYYRDIFISHFSLKPYNGIHIPFEDVYHMKLQLELKSQENNTVEEALSKMEELFAEQKYYSIYYILENIFLEDTVKRQFKNGVCTQNYFMFFAYFAYANANAGTTYSGYDLFQRLYTEAASVSDTTVIIIRYIALWEIINSLYECNKYQEALQKIDCFNRMATAVQNNWKVLFGWDLPSIKYAVNTVKMFIDSENGINCLDKIPAKDFLFSKDIPFSTYRLILCNLTNDFDTAQKILREYNSLVQNRPDCDAKTKYMYNFAVIFLDCINDKVDISEVIVANNLLKENFVHDYNRHIFATSLLALTKGDLPLCEKYRLEYMKTQRPLKVRQLAFEAAYSALVYLHKHQKMAAINELEKEVTLFAERSTYLPVISHNIKYINQYEFSLDDLEFYLGGHLREGKYYIDIRMLY